jgi:hypothetical protein
MNASSRWQIFVALRELEVLDVDAWLEFTPIQPVPRNILSSI